jgi:hypothetical protein
MSRRLIGSVGGLLLASGVSLVSTEAQAYDSLAKACADDPWFCQIGPLAFDETDALPIEWSFDTGWVPQGSPLQVHIWAGVYANTRVSLAGELETSWFEALTLRTPGKKEGGELSFHYGVEIGAEAMISISVAGQNFNWTGDIPYFPQFDFQVESADTFDAWGWKPGAQIEGITQPQTLFQVGIADIVGGAIPGIDGGVQLDVAMELKATYLTEKIVIETTEGELVEGGVITSDEGQSSTPYPGGPNIELDVHPEGFVDYDGVLHLVPTFFVELLGNTWTIPIVDIPIPFPITQTEWVFDPMRVHVPLPDLVLPVPILEFGEVEVGQKSLKTFPVLNAGEAPLTVTLASSDPHPFEAFTTDFEVDPFVTSDGSVRFAPTKNGEFTATIFVGSNDPSDPVQEVLVHGTAFGGDIDEPTADAPSVGEDSGCACRVGPGQADDGSRGLGAAIALLGAAGAVRLRRRRR